MTAHLLLMLKILILVLSNNWRVKIFAKIEWKIQAGNPACARYRVKFSKPSLPPSLPLSRSPDPTGGDWAIPVRAI